jgi:hypothetical protein
MSEALEAEFAFARDSDSRLALRSLRLLKLLNKARAGLGRRETSEAIEEEARADRWYRASLKEIEKRRAARW